jgi:hypothetical protein
MSDALARFTFSTREAVARRLWPYADELCRENELLRAALHDAAEVFVKKIVAEHGSVDMVLQGALLPGIVEVFAVAFEDHDATNYLEMRGLHSRLGTVTIRVQRHDGKTPHELYDEAKAEVARLRAELDKLQRRFL